MEYPWLLAFLIILLLGLVVEAVWFISFLQSIVGGAPFVPLDRERASRMWAAANLKPGEVIYDLGCGDARHLISACRDYPVTAVGVDIAWWPILLAWFRVTANKLKSRVRLVWRSVHRVDLSKADVVYLYLGQKLADSLREKLKRELKPGSRVISAQFPLTGWQPTTVIGDIHHPIYIYQM
jgi:hypothetical protein